jgi:hypothetical protein
MASAGAMPVQARAAIVTCLSGIKPAQSEAEIRRRISAQESPLTHLPVMPPC